MELDVHLPQLLLTLPASIAVLPDLTKLLKSLTMQPAPQVSTALNRHTLSKHRPLLLAIQQLVS